MSTQDTKPREMLDLKKLCAQVLTHTKTCIKPVIESKRGKPLFQKKDVCKTINPIARIFRMIMADRNVTDIELSEAHYNYGHHFGKASREINTDKGNLKKTILKPRMTVLKFEKILDILGLHIVDLTYTIKDPVTGQIKDYRLSDARSYLENGEEDTFKGIIKSSELDGEEDDSSETNNFLDEEDF